ncbi:hypothetical protein [Pseudobacteriovorax antillogorgiicola]|uniref:Uncharacterized protein n=1 Tax=Pseudobacteriovorax antillogorgiicola TaxID=1513793 RepID=A0A1Y6CQD5_9BACT|nr:hypothetical protein [Pseudobacteriovorax antillogorgiicola]TCS42862.1 hypothetical protein EDD56_1386 [Pseudobacteriovorax antillogorgiicola]SMF82017.1 hypothetical protein SAMN06296036_1396 [Pseudobacteriovorax antillogorgiicola]
MRPLIATIIAIVTLLSQIGAAKALVQSCRCAEALESGRTLSCHHIADQDRESDEIVEGARWYQCTCFKASALSTLSSYLAPDSIILDEYLTFSSFSNWPALLAPHNIYKLLELPPPRL